MFIITEGYKIIELTEAECEAVKMSKKAIVRPRQDSMYRWETFDSYAEAKQVCVNRIGDALVELDEQKARIDVEQKLLKNRLDSYKC